MEKKIEDQVNDDFDSPWKEVLEAYFEDFLEFFFPVAHVGIDWQAGHQFLDKELQQVTRDAELGRRYADKLVQVYRIGGEEVWVLIHVEVQAQRDEDFAKRMFTYNYRIFDHYDRPVVSLAVLADQRPGWRPELFSWELWGCRVGIWFPVVKLLDYGDRWTELEASDNPFAVCTMAHLKTMETKGDLVSRRRWKVNLTRRLYSHGRDRQYVINLFRFIDWIMALPDKLARSFWEEMQQFEEEQAMPYVTSVERIGIQKGIQQGIQKGIQQGIQKGVQQGIQQGIQQTARDNILEILEVRFGTVSSSVLKRLEEINDPYILKILHKKALRSGSVDKFKNTMDMILE